MQLAMIGLGRMGGNMVQRLVQGGHEVVVYDHSADAVKAHVAKGMKAAKDIGDVARQVAPRRVVWVMVPAGVPVESTIEQLVPHLSRGDIVIDGGNSNFHDSLRRAEALEEQGIEFVDVGTSGGIWGLTLGYCLMVGASPTAFQHCEPIFRTLAPPEGYAHVGPPGAGHYVKMVHNGIEYGLLQAYAEGYEILHASQDFTLDLGKIAKLWNHGSVVRSWLNELAERAFDRDGELTEHPRVRGGFRRGALDGRGGDAPRRAGPGHHVVAARAVPLTPGGVVRRQGDRRAAQGVRRTRGADQMMVRRSGPPTPNGQRQPALAVRRFNGIREAAAYGMRSSNPWRSSNRMAYSPTDVPRS